MICHKTSTISCHTDTKQTWATFNFRRPALGFRPVQATRKLTESVYSPQYDHQRSRSTIIPKAAAFPQFFPASGPWGVWSGLILAGAFGMWSERTKLGKELSGALVATLAGMALANCGYLPPHPPEVNHVFKFILPLAIPMLLYSADVFRILRETGRLLLAFLLGSACTLAGSLLAMALFPLGSLGADGWKIAAALTARHIGGAVNYMAVSEALEISPSIFGAGLAADDLILTLYFTTLYTLAKAIPPEGAKDQAIEKNSSSSSVKAVAGSQPESQQQQQQQQPPAEASSSSSNTNSSSTNSSSTTSSSSHSPEGGGHSSSAGRVITVSTHYSAHV